MPREKLFDKLTKMPFAPIPNRGKILIALYHDWLIWTFIVLIFVVSTIYIYPVNQIVAGVLGVVGFEISWRLFTPYAIRKFPDLIVWTDLARATGATILISIGLATFALARDPIWLLFVLPLWRIANNDPISPWGVALNFGGAVFSIGLFGYTRFIYEVEYSTLSEYVTGSVIEVLWLAVITSFLYVYGEFFKRVDIADEKRKDLSKTFSEYLFKDATLLGWTRTVLRLTLNTTNAKYATFQIVNRHTGYLRVIAAMQREEGGGNKITELSPFELGQGMMINYSENFSVGLTGYVARSGVPTYALDVTTDSRYLPIFPDTKSEITVPVHDYINNSSVAGILNVEYPQSNALSSKIEVESQMATMQALVDIFQDEFTYILLSELTNLFRTQVLEISKSLDEEKIEIAAMETLFHYYELPLALWMIDDLTSSKFRLKYWRGLPAEYIKSNPQIPISPSHLGESLEYFQAPVHIVNFSSQALDHWKTIKKMKPKPVSVVLIPLRGREGHYGIIEMFVQRNVHFEQHEINLLGNFGTQIGTIIESTRYRKAERQSGALLASEIAAAAHDLGNSLEVLKSVSTKLLSLSKIPSELTLQSNILASELDFIDDIKTLVGFQTLSPSKLPMDFYSIREMIDRAQNTLKNRRYLIEKNLEIIGPDTPLDLAYCNRVVVVGCIRNILKNAVEAGPLPTPVKIRFTQEKDKKYFTIDIINFGKVMSLNAMKSVFEPGFTTKLEGSGFGLSSYRELLRRSGGMLTFEESSPSTGTRFRLRLLSTPLENPMLQ